MTNLARRIAGAALALALIATAAAAQDTYPSRPVSMLVGYAAGGAADAAARMVAQELTTRWGQQVVVENRTGAGGNIAADLIAKGKPDGYSLILVAPAHAINATLYKNIPFDAEKDFTPIIRITEVVNVLVAHPSLGVASVKELVAQAKARPGQINFASGGSGTSGHLAAELFKYMAGIDIVHVPYRGTAAGLPDLLAGRVQMTLDSVTALLPHIQSGALRALGISNAARTPLLPAVPTIAEGGIDGYQVSVWQGIMAPAGMSPDLTSRINRDIAAIMTKPEVAERFAKLGLTPAPGTPAEFRDLIAADIRKYATVIKAAGITGE